MFNKKILSKNFSMSSRKYNKNLKRTKKAFEILKTKIKNSELPVLQSYKKNNDFSILKNKIKKLRKYENIILIGMGGSILGAKSIYSFFKKKIKKKLFFFDNLDINQHLKFKKIKNIKKSCFVIISKSGNTLETITNFNAVSSKLDLKKNSIFITEIKDNVLINIANKIGAEIIGHKDFIGGRYSVFSEVGMLPAALMGLNIKKFANLNKLINNKNFTSSLIKNVTSIYTMLSQGIKNSVILNYDSQLDDLSFWYQQLVGESLGKKGKGINPIVSFGPKDQHTLLQLYLDGPKDKFFTFFMSLNKFDKKKIISKLGIKSINFTNNKTLSSIINAQCSATQNIFNTKKLPFRCFVFEKNNEEELGRIFTFFVLETILLASLMNVNPFNQPAVEQIKLETKKILSK